jgi:beta-glucosidase
VHTYTDWIGLNYYNRKIFGDTRAFEKTDMGWNIDPKGIYDALHILWKYKKPIYIAEAGCADARDRFRAEYIRDTVEAIQTALADGIDVRGYCYWSLLDNYELAEGFEKRFGLVEINYDTLERTVRPSAYVYKDIIEKNK